LRSGSAVIHRLTISGRAERDEGTSKNPSSPSPHDPTSMTARGKRCRRTPQGDRRCQPAVCCPFVIQDRCGSFCRPIWRRSEGEFSYHFDHVGPGFWPPFWLQKCSISGPTRYLKECFA
jgi:hypothetical protein